MAISGSDIFDLKAGQFAVQPTNTKFTRDFVFAGNMVLNDLATDLDEAATEIDDKEDDFDLDAIALNALSCGLDYYLVRFGNKSGDLDLATALQTYKDARRELRLQRDLVESRAATDGEDVFGLTS